MPATGGNRYADITVAAQAVTMAQGRIDAIAAQKAKAPPDSAVYIGDDEDDKPEIPWKHTLFRCGER